MEQLRLAIEGSASLEAQLAVEAVRVREYRVQLAGAEAAAAEARQAEEEAAATAAATAAAVAALREQLATAAATAAAVATAATAAATAAAVAALREQLAPFLTSSPSSPGQEADGSAELAEAVAEVRVLREQLASCWEELAVAAAGEAQLRRQLGEAVVRTAASEEAGDLAAGAARTREEEAMERSEHLLELRQLSDDLEGTRCELQRAERELGATRSELGAARSELEAARSEAQAARLEAGWSSGTAGRPSGAETAARRELLTSPERRELAELRALLAQRGAEHGGGRHGKHLRGDGDLYMEQGAVQGQLVDTCHVQLRDMGLMLDKARGALAAAQRRHAAEVRRLLAGQGGAEQRGEVAEALAAVLEELGGAEAELEQRWEEVAQAEARLGTLLTMGDELAALRQQLANRDRLLEQQGQKGLQGQQGQQGQGQRQRQGQGQGQKEGQGQGQGQVGEQPRDANHLDANLESPFHGAHQSSPYQSAPSQRAYQSPYRSSPYQGAGSHEAPRPSYDRPSYDRPSYERRAAGRARTQQAEQREQREQPAAGGWLAEAGHWLAGGWLREPATALAAHDHGHSPAHGHGPARQLPLSRPSSSHVLRPG